MLIENLTDYEFYNRFYDYNKNGFVFNVVDNHFENFYYFLLELFQKIMKKF